MLHSPDSKVLAALKCCSQSLLSPIVSVVKTHLDAIPFCSDPSKSWQINVNVNPKNSNLITVHHLRHEVGEKEDFTFTWIAQFDLDASKSTPLLNVNVSLYSLEFLSASMFKKAKIKKIIDSLFKNKK